MGDRRKSVKKQLGKDQEAGLESQPPAGKILWFYWNHFRTTGTFAGVLTDCVTLALGTACTSILSFLLVHFFPGININHSVLDFFNLGFNHLLTACAFTRVPGHGVARAFLAAIANINLISGLNVHYAICGGESHHCNCNKQTIPLKELNVTVHFLPPLFFLASLVSSACSGRSCHINLRIRKLHPPLRQVRILRINNDCRP